MSIKHNTKTYLPFLSFLLYLFPASLVLSTFVANTIVYLASVSFFVFLIIENKILILKKKIYFLFILFCFYISIRSLFAEQILFSLKSSLTFVRYLFFILAVSFVVQNNKKFLYNFTKIFFWFFLILVLDAFLQYFYGTNILGYDKNSIENFRISGLFGTELVLGSYLVRMGFLLIALVFLTKAKNANIKALLLISAIGCLTFITGERSSFGLFVLGFFVFFICIQINTKLKIITIAALVASIFIILSTNSGTFQRMITMTKQDLNTSNNIFLVTKGHGSHWKSAIKMFENNKIFGQGSNMYRKLCDNPEYRISNSSCTTHPHNFYIQQLAENGLIGFLFLIGFFLWILLVLIKNTYFILFKNKYLLNNFQICIYICCLINFWPLTTSGNFFGSFLGNMYFLPLAFLINNSNLPKWNFSK